MNKIDPDMKCAPSKKYSNGSCFSIETLKSIAENYNKKNTNKINVNQPKENLVNDLEKKLSDKCDDQTCWIRLDVVKELNNEDILRNTFRPKGPSKKYEWLSTSHINEVIDQYHSLHKDFVFLGAVPSDFEDLPVLGISNINFHDLEKSGKNKIGMVINLDEHWKEGSHWVALYTDLKNNQIYFFDSVAKKPIKRIRKFINRITKYLYNKKYNSDLPINDVIEKIKGKKNEDLSKLVKENKQINNLIGGGFDIRYNHIQHQFNNSECGVYSINFIIRLVGGESFDSVINNITKDEEMNANRKIYFRNVN
jgi:ribosomal protein L34E